MNNIPPSTEQSEHTPTINHPFILRLLSQLLSLLFHPIFIFPYIYIILAWINPQLFGKTTLEMVLQGDNLFLFLRIIFTMVIIPILAVFMMRGLNMISSISMPDRQERIGPYIAVGLSFIISFVQVNNLAIIPALVKVFILGSTLALFTSFLFNLFVKVSLHTVGMGGMLSMTFMSLLSVHILHESQLYILPLVALMAGLVGTARLLLKAHETREIYMGYYIGFLAQFVALFILGF